MQKNVFITGNSTGLGYGLSQEYLQRGWTIYGLSRRGCTGLTGDVHDVQTDLSRLSEIAPALEQLLAKVDQLDLVILNAGILGEIRDLHDTPLDDLKEIMDINLWSNKVILDWLLACKKPIRQIVLMSSGAAVNGNRGWGGYGISKAALNMLAKLYAHEFPNSHLAAFAPGLIHTEMQDYLNDTVDTSRFTSIQALKDARHTPAMPEPRAAGAAIARAFDKLPGVPSGSFVDIRSM